MLRCYVLVFGLLGEKRADSLEDGLEVGAEIAATVKIDIIMKGKSE